MTRRVGGFLLTVGGMSWWCGWHWPGLFPVDDPVDAAATVDAQTRPPLLWTIRRRMVHSDHQQSPLPVIAHASCRRGGTIFLRTAGNIFRGNATEAKVVDAEQASFPAERR